MKKFWILKVIAFVLVATVLVGGVVTLLWNSLMPQIFHLPEITYLQALGILILSKILFSGFKGRGNNGQGWKGAWRARWEAKLAKMTPEEKAKFKAEWEKKCGPSAMWQKYHGGPIHWNDSNPPEPSTGTSEN